MKIELWDVQTNQFLGSYEDEFEALILVRTLVSNFGPAYANDLEMGGTTEDGEDFEPLSGAALIARADDVLARHQNDLEQRAVVIGSKGSPRGAKAEDSMVAAATGSRRRMSEARIRKRQEQ